jgi:hypothetical protein
MIGWLILSIILTQSIINFAIQARELLKIVRSWVRKRARAKKYQCDLEEGMASKSHRDSSRLLLNRTSIVFKLEQDARLFSPASEMVTPTNRL